MYQKYIKEIFNDWFKNAKIDENAVEQINKYLIRFEKLVINGVPSGKKLGKTNLSNSVKKVLPGKLAKHAINWKGKSFIKYDKDSIDITEKGRIFLASVLDYLATEIIELAGSFLYTKKTGRVVKLSNIHLAIKNDDELSQKIN